MGRFIRNRIVFSLFKQDRSSYEVVSDETNYTPAAKELKAFAKN
jgi:hypothetical protein